jgi:hypothetical protein
MIKDRETYIVYKGDDEGARDILMREVSSDSSGSPPAKRKH